jgi:GNAT superfamily N-acetyltransferase
MAVACSIRPAADGDAGAISRVIVAALRQTNARDYAAEIIARLEKSFSPAAVRELIAKQKMFVAVLGRQIVGTAGLDGSMVRSFFVAPDAQGTGIGSRLMAAVENAARAAGITTLMLQSSVTAEPFYVKLGFKALRDSYYGDERTIIMERDIMERDVIDRDLAPLYILVRLWIHKGREAQFEAYERKVSRIMARYRGVIEHAIRTSRAPDDGSDQPFEVHVLKFPSRELYDAYRADADRRALTSERDGIITKTDSLVGTPGPAYGS